MADTAPKPNPPDDKPTPDGEAPSLPASSRWWLVFWLGLVVVLIVSRLFFDSASTSKEIGYSEFKDEVRAGNVQEVLVRGQQVVGRYVMPLRIEDGEDGEENDRFVTFLPSFEDPELMALLEEHAVVIRAEKEETLFSPLLIAFLPLLLLFLLLFYTSRTMRQQFGDMSNRMTGFGKSRAKRFEKSMSRVSFEDVAGLENAKQELSEVVDFLRDPSLFQRLGARIPKGVLLMGPPGTGKTLLARAVAGEADAPFFSISGSEFVELFVGIGASRVRDMFETAKKEAPAILFIDEIDSVGRARGTGLGGGHDEREQTLNQILAEMDGFSAQESVVAIAATNRPDVLDSALLRPGRFDRKITLELPQRNARREILEVHTKKVPLAEGLDLETVAAGTVGFSGADLANLVNEAALFAARQKKEKVGQEDFELARDRILLGSEREDFLVDKEKRVVAYHEAGHAVLARLQPETDPLRKVTIIPRGRALGATEQQPDEDRHNVSLTYLEARIVVLLGGRVAEKIVFDQVTSGAEEDLKQVTQLAKRMICQWGMSEEIGPVSFRHGEEHVFLGREMAQTKDFSEHTARRIDEEIQHLVHRLEERATSLLEKHRDKLDRLAAALLDQETLDAAEIDEVLELDGAAASAPS